ncbi:type VI secretion system-associated protein TagF [Massilia sp. CFBP9026]|uniref:type VI secretion system-associated protein TagF n=1 Tax=Massilia sp. CFBP9026 TaxID=3096536 RepID=UPI002A69A37D|nr:type VI secretion system-associated protein TagF [Massilia sp. CFBP9026]MDY0962144.1 type VI secretion system-associated protein TagF [Massilia sp. CFBP9026]
MRADRIGYFGKVPARADFVKLAHDPAAIGMLDAWLAQVMTLLPSDARWRFHYDAMAPVSFALVGPARHHAVAGHLLASHDQSGRRFPFLATRTLAVSDPAAFVARCPLAFAPLWVFLEEICPKVLGEGDPTAYLQAIADSAIGLGDEAALARWMEHGTIASLDALLDRCGVARLVLALGLLLQPVMHSQPAELHKSLVLPLPHNPSARYPVAAFWLELITPFLRRAQFDLALFITRQEERPVLVVGFCAALAETLRAVIDPLVGAELQVRLLDTDWIDEQLQFDADVRQLSSHLAQPDLPLSLARDLFMKTFIGA